MQQDTVLKDVLPLEGDQLGQVLRVMGRLGRHYTNSLVKSLTIWRTSMNPLSMMPLDISGKKKAQAYVGIVVNCCELEGPSLSPLLAARASWCCGTWGGQRAHARFFWNVGVEWANGSGEIPNVQCRSERATAFLEWLRSHCMSFGHVLEILSHTKEQ